jgi:hypothetical protein
MNELTQSLVVGGAILASVVYLLTRSRKKSCDKGCGCGTKAPVKEPKEN